jgi:DNA-3-methyladenine glycosylase II
LTPHSALPDGPYPAGALSHLRRADPVLDHLIVNFGLVTRELNRPPFYSLLAAIVGQQISVKAAAAIMGRLIELFPEGRPVGPVAIAAVPFETLRAIGLSNAKARYVHDLAEEVSAGVVDLALLPRLADEEVIASLVQIKGIGRWTAEMFLIIFVSCTCWQKAYIPDCTVHSGRFPEVRCCETNNVFS